MEGCRDRIQDRIPDGGKEPSAISRYSVRVRETGGELSQSVGAFEHGHVSPFQCRMQSTEHSLEAKWRRGYQRLEESKGTKALLE